MASEPQTKRARSQWDKSEKLKLVSLIRERRNVILSKCSSAETKRRRSEAWEEIVQILNSQHRSQRCTQEVKKQWQNLKQFMTLQQARKQEREAGGDCSDRELGSVLKAVRELISADNLILGGSPEGLDEMLDAEKAEEPAHEFSTRPGPSGMEHLLESLSSDVCWEDRSDGDFSKLFTIEEVDVETCDSSAVAAAPATVLQQPKRLPAEQLELPGGEEQESQSTCDSKGAACGKRPASLRQSRSRQHALQLEEILELNRKNIELKTATLQARQTAAETDLATSTSVAEATAKVVQAAAETLGKYAALAHQLGDVAVAAKGVLCSKKKVLDLKAQNLELEGRRRLLELENLELEKKRRLLELRKLECNTNIKG